MKTPNVIARTGRVQNWINDPTSRLPVSCTVFVVEDSMEGLDGIESSWRFVSHALRNGAGVAVHLSKLRPKGDENGKGLTASGPVSFAKIYSTLNETLRRGGHYKNGAVVCHLDYDHPDAIEFVNASRADLPWVKRCLDVDQYFLECSDPELDRQVGLGVLGLANFLAYHHITYAQFGEALEQYRTNQPISSTAYRLVSQMALGIEKAAIIARKAGMVRAFAIAPTASCSYNNVDLRGYTTAPEIAPPISRNVDRDSGTFGVDAYHYPPDMEIAAEVGWDNYNKVVDGLVSLFRSTMLFHGYSYNSWSDVVTYDEEFIQKWLLSPQTSLYYSLQVMPDVLAKDDALGALNEEFHEFFKFNEDPLEEVPPSDDRCIPCGE